MNYCLINIGKCQEIRPESLFQCSRRNLHTWRHSSGKLPCSLKLESPSWSCTSAIWNMLSCIHPSAHGFQCHLTYFQTYQAPCILWALLLRLQIPREMPAPQHWVEGFHILFPSVLTVTALDSGWRLSAPWFLKFSNRRSGSREQPKCSVPTMGWTLQGSFPGEFLCFPPGSLAQVAFAGSPLGPWIMMHLHRLLHSTLCSSQCRCAAPSHGMHFPNGPARPVLGGALGRPLPSLLAATAFPGTSSHLQLLTPITGPQARRVLACSETDVERCVFRVASHLCLKHLL